MMSRWWRRGPRLQKERDDVRAALMRALRCTYEGCATGDEAWMAIERNPGTDAEGTLAVLCATHFKMMCDPDTDEEVFLTHVQYVEVGLPE